MRKLTPLPAVLAIAFASPLAADDHALPAPGIWTNTEDAYFASEEGREQHAWYAVEISEHNQWRTIDALGTPQGEWQDGAIPDVTAREGGGWQVFDSELRQARPFFCWISVRKFARKPDGSEDWTFQRNLPMFDQGGRIHIAGNGEAPDVTIRMRNVTWAKGSRNKPSLVLYVHKEDPDRAVSYSWAAQDATMVGINLRWVQASCSLTTSEAEVS